MYFSRPSYLICTPQAKIFRVQKLYTRTHQQHEDTDIHSFRVDQMIFETCNGVNWLDETTHETTIFCVTDCCYVHVIRYCDSSCMC